jgi:hypothetical protein
MSQIFYSQIDANLETELNARGNAGARRSNADLNHMIGKISNVEITAYVTSSYDANYIISDTKLGVLGGDGVRVGRYLPTGENGYLNENRYDTTTIVFDAAGNASAEYPPLTDATYRIAPYVTSMDVQIGDHSMGLLNRATVAISIPNPQRDLDTIEETWLRPGRLVKIEIAQTDDAVITGLLLSQSMIPAQDKLKELYNPATTTALDTISKNLRKMNSYQFYGLITSFEFSYQTNGTVDATISLTGTSNVYTDVSMWIKTEQKPVEAPKTTFNYNAPIGTPPAPTANTTTAPVNGFYETLYKTVDTAIGPAAETKKLTGIITYPGSLVTTTDQYILYGETYPQQVDDDTLVRVKQENLQLEAANTAASASNVITSQQNATALSQSLANPAIPYNYIAPQEIRPTASIVDLEAADKTSSIFARYITLGALVHFINVNVIDKMKGSVLGAKLQCDDIQCNSNYYSELTSCIPNEVLFLPRTPADSGGPNTYGELTYYKQIKDQVPSNWHGYSDAIGNGAGDATKEAQQALAIKPSRIFLNLAMIEDILLGKEIAGARSGGLTSSGTTGFILRDFMNVISSKIKYATGGAINMSLMTNPNAETELLFTDVKCLKTPDGAGGIKKVIPYSVPMLANHANGTIVRDFKLSATLPENVKNLSYVLNSGDDVSEEDIAPFMNFMYNSKDPEKINEITAKYKKKHDDTVLQLKETRAKLGQSPMVAEIQRNMYKQLTTYIKFPTSDIRKSQQITSPIFPFSAEFTIDGINGLRYGDVLTFAVLPLKYKVNTVFSIIGITHTVGNDGIWQTNVRCIMRPSLD